MDEAFEFYYQAINEILNKKFKLEGGARHVPDEDYQKLVYYLGKAEEELKKNPFKKSEEVVIVLGLVRHILKGAEPKDQSLN